MSEQTLCNDCKNEVKYINTRKQGVIKCEPSSLKAVQESGRIVEVYLLHECKTRNNDKVSSKATKKPSFWIRDDLL